MNKVTRSLIEGRLINKSVINIKKYFSTLIKSIDEVLGIAYRQYLGKRLKITPNKIVFMTYQNQYTCNPKYITEQLKENEKLELVWIVDKATLKSPQDYGIPSSVRLVERNTYQSFVELMTAKIWVDNALNCLWKIIPKKKGQIYIDTWHGSMGIKRLDTYNPSKGYWRSIAKKSNHYIDYLISNSRFEEEIFKSAYWPDVKVLRVGHPRNDLFYNKELMVSLRKKVLDYYGFEDSVKLLLYAPTFRENKDISCFNIDYEKLYEELDHKFPGEWKIFLRFHFHNKKSAQKGLPEYVVNATEYPDMQELIAAADIGLTDYSSWIYDFMLSGKPCFIYASDIKLYNNQRGFYYPLEETPFSIAQNTEELCSNILHFNEIQYAENVDKFLKDKGCMEDGHASERIGDVILNIICADHIDR